MRATKPVLNPISVTITYAALATCWILASDSLILWLGLSAHATFLFATVKGTLFVCVTTLILYLLLRGMVAQIARSDALQRSLERQFHQAQRMEALGQLASNVSHDFRNHLMVISGYMELLEVTNENSRVKRDSIVKAVQKCDKLSRELLAYSRRQEMHPVPVKVRNVISEFTSMLGTIMGKNISHQTQVNSESVIFIDPAQLEQVLMNLALNSKDAMPQGGTFSIEASDLQLEAELHDPKVPPGKYVQVAVSDTGEGIPEDHRARLFEPFFTTKERGNCTGLGLAAAYGIVKQCGGFIFVESGLGSGTTFRLLFPKLER